MDGWIDVVCLMRRMGNSPTSTLRATTLITNEIPATESWQYN